MVHTEILQTINALLAIQLASIVVMALELTALLAVTSPAMELRLNTTLLLALLSATLRVLSGSLSSPLSPTTASSVIPTAWDVLLLQPTAPKEVDVGPTCSTTMQLIPVC